jgi:hypothetical protein
MKEFRDGGKQGRKGQKVKEREKLNGWDERKEKGK